MIHPISYEIKVRHTVCDQDMQVLSETYRTYLGSSCDNIKYWFKKYYMIDNLHVCQPTIDDIRAIRSTTIEYTKQSMAGDCEFYFKKVFKHKLDTLDDTEYNLGLVFQWLDDVEAISQV